MTMRNKCRDREIHTSHLPPPSEKNESFRGYLKQLEEDQRPLRSLLKAPMDRVTQLPHHLRTILRKTPTTDLNHCLVEVTLKALEKVGSWQSMYAL